VKIQDTRHGSSRRRRPTRARGYGD
jgi:hypothetical protein